MASGGERGFRDIMQLMVRQKTTGDDRLRPGSHAACGETPSMLPSASAAAGVCRSTNPMIRKSAESTGSPGCLHAARQSVGGPDETPFARLVARREHRARRSCRAGQPLQHDPHPDQRTPSSLYCRRTIPGPWVQSGIQSGKATPSAHPAKSRRGSRRSISVAVVAGDVETQKSAAANCQPPR